MDCLRWLRKQSNYKHQVRRRLMYKIGSRVDDTRYIVDGTSLGYFVDISDNESLTVFNLLHGSQDCC